MKRSKTHFGVLLTAIILIIGACQKAEQSDPLLPTTSAESSLPQCVSEGTELSADDAAKVATLFRKADAATRSGTAPVVRNVVTIRDAAGRPALYAVNLQEGYLLISATKRFFPVLAQIDYGTFTLDREPSGLDVVLQEMVETIEAVRDSAAVFDCRHAWFPYEERTRPERAQTRMTDDEFYDIQNEWYGKWYDEGVDTHRLASKPDDMPEDIYRRFCETAEGDDAWVDTEYYYMNTAIITEKYIEEIHPDGPFIQSEWKQTNPYNEYVGQNRPLGCVTIAVGQLMRYYRHPSSFNWSDMPYHSTTPTLSSFLAQLRIELNVTDDGNCTTDDAKRVLTNYGYNCIKIDHNESAVKTSLRNQRPVFTRGYDKTAQGGHAWIIDGYKLVYAYTEYKLYTVNASQTAYNEMDSHRVYHATNSYYHINWGWGGTHNAWTIESLMAHNYTSGRQDIIINSY